jgi:light-regulated signal transduction histidine kinase (bacteriophytochrome)
LRAPLRGISGFSQALAEDYADALDPQGKDYIRRITKATQHLTELIDDLLMLSRVTRTEMNQDTSVDLSGLAQSISEQLKSAQPARQVEWVIQPGTRVDGDANLLRIALENLLGNAWKFTSKVPAARIEFGTVGTEDGKTIYFVRDNGAGFEMAYASKLFGAFQRLHKTSDFPGTGIGLATVQRVIHRHGGRVWAEGEPNRGATFYFTL